MQNLPEGLIYLLVLAVAYLANDLFKRFGPKMEPEPPQAEVDEGPTAQEPVPVGLAAASIASFTLLPGPQVAVAKAMLPTQPRGQLPRLALLGSKRSSVRLIKSRQAAKPMLVRVAAVCGVSTI